MTCGVGKACMPERDRGPTGEGGAREGRRAGVGRFAKMER